MSNYSFPVSVILSLAVLTGCSDSSPDQPDSAAPPVIVLPVGEAPDGADGSPNSDDVEPVETDAEVPDEPEEQNAAPAAPPAEETPAPENPPTSDPGSPVESDNAKGEEITAESFWEFYSQPGVWRRTYELEGRGVWRDDQPTTVFLDAAMTRKELYSVTAINSDSAIFTECVFGEVKQLSRDSMFEPDADDEEPVEGCATPELKFFQISNSSLRIENHCEDGKIIDVKMDRISSSPVFTHGTLVFTAHGMSGAAIDANICSDIMNVRDTFVAADGGPPDIEITSDSQALTFETWSTYQGQLLRARFTFLADLELSDGIRSGEEYQVGSIGLGQTAEAVDVRWVSLTADDRIEGVFTATSGSARILELTEYTAKISFNVSGYDGKSVVGEMTVNLQ